MDFNGIFAIISFTVLAIFICVYCFLYTRRANKQLCDKFKEETFLRAQRLIELESLDRAKQERILGQEKAIKDLETQLAAKVGEIEKMRKSIRDDRYTINKLSLENAKLMRKLESATKEEE